MGNRAIIVFEDGSNDYSPQVYLHYSGSSVPQLLDEWWKLMEGRHGDVEYGVARFVGIAHEHIGGNMSLGVFNTKVTKDQFENGAAEVNYWLKQSPRDSGVFIVHCATGNVRRIFTHESAMHDCDAPRIFNCKDVTPAWER